MGAGTAPPPRPLDSKRGGGGGGVGGGGGGGAPINHATRHARRLYVGNLPPDTSESEIGGFFSAAMERSGGAETPGPAVVSVYLNLEKRFAFIELRTLSEAVAALSMDGLLLRGLSLRLRRPNDYNPAAVPAGITAPTTFRPTALGIVSTQVADGPHKVFVGGIPYHLSEDHIKELLCSYGALRAFNLIKDPATGLSKGYAFFEYEAGGAAAAAACAGLNGMKVGERTLSVRMAWDPAGGGGAPGQGHGGGRAAGGPDGGPGGVRQAVPPPPPRPGGAAGLGAAAAAGGPGGTPYGATRPPPPPVAAGVPGAPPGVAVAALLRPPSRVLVLHNMVTAEELADDAEHAEIVEDVRDECAKAGPVILVQIPRPTDPGGPGGAPPPGVGRVFVQFEQVAAATAAHGMLDGRKFGGRAVVAAYMDETAFAVGKLD